MTRVLSVNKANVDKYIYDVFNVHGRGIVVIVDPQYIDFDYVDFNDEYKNGKHVLSGRYKVIDSKMFSMGIVDTGQPRNCGLNIEFQNEIKPTLRELMLDKLDFDMDKFRKLDKHNHLISTYDYDYLVSKAYEYEPTNNPQRLMVLSMTLGGGNRNPSMVKGAIDQFLKLKQMITIDLVGNPYFDEKETDKIKRNYGV